MKFPNRLRHRGKGKVLATIYKTPNGYRLYWRVRVDGKPKSRMRDFTIYSAAKREGDAVIADLSKGKVSPLSPAQASDAVAALEGLQRFYQDTGRRLSLRAAIGEYCEAARKLKDTTLTEAVERFINTVAIVQRKPLAAAVAEFVESRKPLCEAKDGKRPKHSPVCEAHVASWLGEFAATLSGLCVCDLTKDLLNVYIGGFKELSAKSRNDRRAVVRMFLRWCVAKDYLSQTHRLFEAVDFKSEDSDITEIEFYSPVELRSMLEATDATLRPVIALAGLAGLRREEILRLDWSDVWRVQRKIEISARIAKGRKRRLVDICPALAAWLRPYRSATGLVWSGTSGELEKAYASLRSELEIPSKRNGLRHAYITYHMAVYSNENLTAALAGNSPGMLHDHYRGVATAAEGRKWFAVKPAKSARNVIPMPAATNR